MIEQYIQNISSRFGNKIDCVIRKRQPRNIYIYFSRRDYQIKFGVTFYVTSRSLLLNRYIV